MNWFNGLLDLPWWGVVAFTLVLTHITIAAVTIYLHRHQAHRALDLHPIVSHFFRFWLWLTTGMVTREWVSIHRKHHAKCETPDDPHSPQIVGINKVLWEGAELYRKESRNQETLDKYSIGTPDDWMEHKLYGPHSKFGIGFMLAADILLLGPIGITVWAVQMMWIPLLAAGVINGLGHYMGYRNYDSPDAATNISPWGILIGGEELHNNHHAFPTSAKLSSKAWEFDIGWLYIRTLQAVGLAKVKRVAPKPVMATNKAVVDMETVRAIIVNRLHVMSDYSRQVALPVLNKYRAEGAEGGQIKRIKNYLVNNSIVSQEQRQAIEKSMADYPLLETVYEYRQKLQDLWGRSTSNQERLLASLQDWCAQAEKTGIDALAEFAHTIRQYTVPVKHA